jgi:hypothetical protein
MPTADPYEQYAVRFHWVDNRKRQRRYVATDLLDAVNQAFADQDMKHDADLIKVEMEAIEG